VNDTIRVLAAVLRRQDRVLLCQRPVHKRHGGLWELPGGKLEAGESLHDAAVRELQEELALQATSVGPALFTCSDPGSAYVIEFALVDADGEPHALEHAALAWVTLEEAASMSLAPADRAFIEFARAQGSGWISLR